MNRNPAHVTLFRDAMLGAQRTPIEVDRRELRPAISEKRIATLLQERDDAFRRNLSLFQIVQMELKEQRGSMRRKKRGRTFDGLVFVTFDIELDEIRNNPK